MANTAPIAVEDDEYYMVQLPSGDTLHADREAALSHLRESMNGMPEDEDAVEVMRVNYGGEQWEIAPLEWRSIAMSLLSGGEN